MATVCDLTFPGIQDWQGCTIMRSLGVVPDPIRVRYTPQNSPPASFGNLRFTYEGPEVGRRWLQLNDCVLDRVTAIWTDNGWIHEATLLDARWKWQHGLISGAYNIPDPTGEILAGTERTPRELATLCLRAMFNLPEEEDTGRRAGSRRRAAKQKLARAAALPFDVSKLPNETRPRTEWDDANPARSLERLCDSLGCVVCFKWSGKVVIERLGGANPVPQRNRPYNKDGTSAKAGPATTAAALLPFDDDTTNINITLDPKETPDAVVVVMPPRRWEVVLPLEPVGLDTDGQYKPVYDLSYLPTKDHPFYTSGAQKKKVGWIDGTDPVTGPISKPLAEETVFRCYRIQVKRTWWAEPHNFAFAGNEQDPLFSRSMVQSSSNPGDRFWQLELPGFGLVDDLWQILPIEANRISFSYDPLRTDFVTSPPGFFGLFENPLTTAPPNAGDRNNFDPLAPRVPNAPRANQLDEGRRLPLELGYTIDRDRGIVKFGLPIWRVGTPKYSAPLPAGRPLGVPQLFPILFMRVAISVRDRKSRAWFKPRVGRKIGNRGTGPAPVYRDDLQHNMIVRYDYSRGFGPVYVERKDKDGNINPNGQFLGLETNEATIINLAEKQLDATIEGYQTTQPQVMSYRGLRLFETDGAIRQVMVQAGDDGFCETMASRDDEALGTDLRLNEKQQIGAVLDIFNRGASQDWADEIRRRHTRKDQN